MEVYAIFCTRMDFIKIFVMSLDLAEIKTIKTHVHGDDKYDAFSASTAIFWFISDETIYQNKSWCFMLDVDGYFIYLFGVK